MTILPKIYIAIPCYNGTIDCGTTSSIVNTMLIIQAMGWDASLNFLPGDPLLHSVRNKLVKSFLESDCTHLFFIDCDVTWEPAGFIKIVAQDKDFCAGAVPVSGTNICRFALDTNSKRDGDLIGVDVIGAAFLCVKKDVFSRIREAVPGLSYGEAEAFFDFERTPTSLIGEDVSFCHKCKKAGIDMWIYPDITFTHAGMTGNYKNKEQFDKALQIKINHHRILKSV